MELLKKSYLVFLLLCLLPIKVVAVEDRAWPIITFTCDQVKDEAKIKNEVKWGEAGKNYPFSAEQGTYNPWELVSVKDKKGTKTVSTKGEWEFSCLVGGFNYTFVVRPKIFNRNFEGKCGDKLSVSVTILKGATTILENEDMEKFCHGNTPILMGIKVKGGESKAKLFKVPRSRFY